MTSNASPFHLNSPWLYDGVVPSGHTWANELSRLETAPLVQEQCLGANLAMDARVTPDARVQWASVVVTPSNLLQELGQQWRRSYIQHASSVRFTGSPYRLPAKRGLTHIEPFEGMFKRALGGDPAQLAALDIAVANATGLVGLVYSLKAPANYAELARILNSVAEQEFKDIIGLALRCIESQGPRPFWWATLSEELAAHANDATLLCSALGLGNYAQDNWVLAFDYTSREAGLLYRPTTLDAGGYAFHFPSPSTSPYGTSMALRPSEDGCTEILHHALPWGVAADSVRPSVLQLEKAWSPQEVYDSLPEQRRHHREVLLDRFSSDQPWLARHSHRI